MLLAIDIGNSNITLGCIRDGEIRLELRIATDPARTSDQYGLEIRTMLEAGGIRREELRDCIISSVVPPVFNSVWAGVYKFLGKRPMVVTADMDTGLDICLDFPAQVGADRIVVAVAALEAYEAPLTIIDMGTATTIECVEPGRRYVGGVILPGLRISLDALTGRTAQLPAISLGRPGRVVAANTADCMRSGIMYGTAAMLDGLLDMMREELGHPSTVIATGGLAPFIVPLCRHEIRQEPDLLLRGLDALYRRNKKA